MSLSDSFEISNSHPTKTFPSAGFVNIEPSDSVTLTNVTFTDFNSAVSPTANFWLCVSVLSVFPVSCTCPSDETFFGSSSFPHATLQSQCYNNRSNNHGPLFLFHTFILHLTYSISHINKYFSILLCVVQYFTKT